MIKDHLSKHISLEPFRFLQHRQIMDVVVIAQECIHSIKVRNKDALLFKFYLYKAYDCVDWCFLRLVLHKVGFFMEVVDWIMPCITFVNFVILIKGVPCKSLGPLGC